MGITEGKQTKKNIIIQIGFYLSKFLCLELLKTKQPSSYIIKYYHFL